MTRPDRAELIDSLVDGVRLLTESQRWMEYLAVQSRFYRYSFGNVMLIAAQCPDATRVAGFKAWKGMGRSVCAGEQAIWILAPVVGRCRAASSSPAPMAGSQDEASIHDPATSQDEAGSEDRRLRGFRPVPVFDVSQTEGIPLPEVCQLLVGDDLDRSFEALSGCAHGLGYSVTVCPLPSGVNGDCTFSERRIRVEVANSPAQQVKTLAHELAHAMLHENEHDRARAELEAESTAFVVCQVLGLDTRDYSFGYVAAWAGGGEEAIAAITASGAAIQRASSAILAEVETCRATTGEAAVA